MDVESRCGEDPDAPDSLLSMAFHCAPVGLVVAQNRVIKCYNEAFSNIFGYRRDVLVGQSLDCLYPSHHEFEYIGERALVVMSEHGSYSDERIMRHQTGRLFWCRVTGGALNKSSPFARATWVFEDISTQRPVAAQLTVREREIAQLLILGKSSKVIGQQLHISHRTVEAHRTRLMRKLEAASAGELVARLIGNVGQEPRGMPCVAA